MRKKKWKRVYVRNAPYITYAHTSFTFHLLKSQKHCLRLFCVFFSSFGGWFFIRFFFVFFGSSSSSPKADDIHDICLTKRKLTRLPNTKSNKLTFNTRKGCFFLLFLVSFYFSFFHSLLFHLIGEKEAPFYLHWFF